MSCAEDRPPASIGRFIKVAASTAEMPDALRSAVQIGWACSMPRIPGSFSTGGGIQAQVRMMALPTIGALHIIQRMPGWLGLGPHRRGLTGACLIETGGSAGGQDQVIRPSNPPGIVGCRPVYCGKLHFLCFCRAGRSSTLKVELPIESACCRRPLLSGWKPPARAADRTSAAGP